MRSAILFVAMTLVLLLTTSAVSADPWLDVEGRYWLTDLSGKTRSSLVGGSSFEFDDKADLGLNDKDAWEARLTARIPLTNHRFRASYMPIHFTGDRVLSRTVTFAGNAYPAGTRIQTDIDIDYARLGWSWLGIKIPFSDLIKIGPMIEAKGFWTHDKFSATGFGTDDRHFGLVLPTVGVMAEANPKEWLNLFAEASGIPGGKYGHFLEAEAGVRLIPVKYCTIIGGYHYFDIEAVKGQDFANFTVSGPFTGASVRF